MGALTLIAGPAALALAVVAAVLVGVPALGIAALVWLIRQVGSLRTPVRQADVLVPTSPMYYPGHRS